MLPEVNVFNCRLTLPYNRAFLLLPMLLLLLLLLHRNPHFHYKLISESEMKTCIFLLKVTRGGIVGLQMDFLSFSFFVIPLNILVQIFVDSGEGGGRVWEVGVREAYCCSVVCGLCAYNALMCVWQPFPLMGDQFILTDSSVTLVKKNKKNNANVHQNPKPELVPAFFPPPAHFLHQLHTSITWPFIKL